MREIRQTPAASKPVLAEAVSFKRLPLPKGWRDIAEVSFAPPRPAPKRPDPAEVGFFSRCENPTREEICIASLSRSLRGQVADGTLSQSEADKKLADYRQRLAREPLSPGLQVFMSAAAAQSMAAEEIIALFGKPVVLLKIARKEKKPVDAAWQTKTVADMKSEYLASLNGETNIGISHGAPSNGLIGVEFDDSAHAKLFWEANAWARNGLWSKAKRGPCFWAFIKGECPANHDLYDEAGAHIGEWRSTGRQTVFSGVHPEGLAYRNSGRPPAELAYSEIIFPSGILKAKPRLAPAPEPEPEADADAGLLDDAQLRAEWGEPVVFTRNGAKINHAYFVRRFCLEHHVVFETTEKAFYLYEDSSGAWKYVDDGVIKELVRADWLRVAMALGGNALAVMGTDVFLNQLVNGVRSMAGKAGAFKRLGRGLIHVGNWMLQLHSSGEHELFPFSHEYFSRNPIPVNFNPEAKCPKFLQLLKDQLSDEDRSLVHRWMGSCLLQGNAAQRLIIFSGVGKNAKSTLVNVVVKLLGRRNVGALRTKLLDDRFEIGRLRGKTLLTACDVPGKFLQHAGAGVIKRLTGGDYVPGEGKGVMKEVEVDGDFGMAITCNETLLVRLYGDDDVTAWQRRLLLVKFTTPIEATKRVEHYDDKLIAEEAEGILAYIVKGAVAHLHELENGGDFRLSAEQKERVDKLLMESQSLRFFLKERVAGHEGADLSTEEIVRAYFAFCKERQWTTSSTRIVEAELKDLMPEIHGSHHSHNVPRCGKDVRGYKNVTFRQEGEGPEE